MYNLVFENQGINTFLIYQLQPDDQVDTLSLGMITKNKIPGVVPAVFTQMNDDKFLKYNVTSKLSLRQLLEGAVNKKRILGAFLGIATGMLEAEEYMIDANLFLLDLDYIFADVSSCEAMLICLPIIQKDSVAYDMKMFFKNIVFSTQFDQKENCDYVARLISYLNGVTTFSLADFRDTVYELLYGVKPAKDSVDSKPIALGNMSEAAKSAVPMGTRLPNMEKQPDRGLEPIHNVQPDRGLAPVHNMQPERVIPTGRSGQIGSTPIGPKSDGKDRPVGVLIPGQDGAGMNTTVSTNPGYNNVPVTKNKKSLFSKKTKEEKQAEKMNKKNKNIGHYNQVLPVTNLPYANQPYANQPQINTPVYSQVSQSVNQPMNQQAPGNFGGTVVLSNSNAGETTVLSADTSTGKQGYLIRQMNNQKVSITNPMFRIGKEASYADYCISDNPAVSRSHANIVYRNGKYYILDTNSANHTYINDEMIPSNVERELSHGVRLRLANEWFTFYEY